MVSRDIMLGPACFTDSRPIALVRSQLANVVIPQTASIKLVPLSRVFMMVAPWRSAPVRSAISRLDPTIRAPRRLAPLRLVQERSDWLRSVPDRLAFSKSALDKLEKDRLAPEALADVSTLFERSVRFSVPVSYTHLTLPTILLV